MPIIEHFLSTDDNWFLTSFFEKKLFQMYFINFIRKVQSSATLVCLIFLRESGEGEGRLNPRCFLIKEIFNIHLPPSYVKYYIPFVSFPSVPHYILRLGHGEDYFVKVGLARIFWIEIFPFLYIYEFKMIERVILLSSATEYRVSI